MTHVGAPLRPTSARTGSLQNCDPDAARNLGLLIDENKLVPGVTGSTDKPKLVARSRVVQRVTGLVDTMMEARDNETIRQHEEEICRAPAKGYGTTEFDMSSERLESLINGGRLAMQEYLASHHF